MSGGDELLNDLQRALAGRDSRPIPEPWSAAQQGLLGWQDYRESLAEAAGEFVEPVSLGALSDAVAEIAGEFAGHTRGAAKLLSVVAGPFDAVSLDGLEWMVARGFMAAARPGVVAVSNEDDPVRLQFLLPECLLLLVPEDALVDDLDALYASIDPTSLAGGYMTLIGGPSKTADIEQTLVTGAHGPRRLVVMPYRDHDSRVR